MRLKEVEVTNIKGIEYLKFPVGDMTIITGANGSGKSSLLDAITAPFAGGHDPSLLRLGAKKGGVLLTLDEGSTIDKSITPKNSTLTIKNPAGEVVPAPATFIATLAKGFAFDPLAFVTAPHKERADYLSKVMPVAISAVQVIAACDQKRLANAVAKLVPTEVFDIAKLNGLRKRIFDDRAGVNKQIKVQEGGIDALRKTLPPNWKPEGDPHGIVNDAQMVVRDKEAALTAIKKRRDAAVGDWDATLTADLSEVDRWEAAEIDKIRVEAAGVRKAKAEEGKATRETLYHSVDTEIEAAEADVSTAKQAQSVAAEQAKHFATQQQSAATIKQYQSDMRDSQAEEEVLTATITAIDSAKEKALKTSPIPGLMVIDGEVMYQQEDLEAPIPFDAVNRQRQYEIALRIAAEGAGELGLMVLDNTEALDTEHWSAFKAACASSGFQVIAARVSDDASVEVTPINA